MQPGTEVPYPGLIPFAESDRVYFFGRESDARVIVSNLLAAPLTVLYGESGVGKSSALYAAAIPLLRESARTVLVSIRGWHEPAITSELKRQCVAAADALAETATNVDPALPLDELLRRISETVRCPVMLIFDQFEEYLAGHIDPAFEAEFARAVNRVDVNCGFLLSMREDSLARLDRFRTRIPHLLANTIRLEHLTRRAGSEAIERPLAVYAARHPGTANPTRIDETLVSDLLNELDGRDGRPGVQAPLLQIVMRRLWLEEGRAGSPEIRAATLRALGGVRKIGDDHLNRVMDALTRREKLIADRMLRLLVTASGEKRAVSDADLIAESEDSPDRVQAVLVKLTEGRVLAAVGAIQAHVIQHDALAPAIVDWRVRFRRSRDLARARARTVALLILLILACGAAWWWRRLAHRESSRALARSASTEIRRDPERATLLALRAIELANTPEAGDALFNALEHFQTAGEFQAGDKPITRVSYAPGGQDAITAGRDGSVKLWNLASRANTADWTFPDPVLALALDAKRNVAAVGTSSGEIGIFDFSRPSQLRRWKAHASEITDLAFDSATGRLASVSGDGRVAVWQSGFTTPASWTLEFDGEPHAVAFSPDGRRLACGMADGRVIELPVGAAAAPPGKRVHAAEVRRIAYTPDGKSIVSAGADSAVRVTSSVALDPVQAFFGHSNTVTDLQLSPDAKRLVTSSTDGTVRVWDFASTAVLQVLQGRGGRVNSAAFSPDGKHVIGGCEDGFARMWDVPPHLASRAYPAGGPVYRVAYDGSGRLAFATGAGDVGVIGLNGTVMPAAERHAGGAFAVAFDPSGDVVASGGADGAVCVWDSHTGSLRSRLQAGDKLIADVAFSPDKRFLASVGWDGFARMWELDGKSPPAQFSLDGAMASGVAFTPDSRRLLATDHTGRITIWDVARRSLLAQAHSQNQVEILALALRPDGKLFATGDNTGAVSLWRLPVAGDPTNLARLPVNGHWIQGLAFIGAGDRLTTADRSGVVAIIETRFGTQLRTFLDHTGPVYGVAVSRDGRLIATGGADQTIRVFALGVDQLVAAARKRVTRRLTPDECREFVQLACVDDPDSR